MVAPLYTTASGLLFHAGKILVMTIGLPARGKTHISRALERYLRWMGVKTQVISLGDYRRKTLGGAQQLPPDYFTLGEELSSVFLMSTDLMLPSYRREEPRDYRFTQEDFRWLRKASMGFFRKWRTSRYLRREQWIHCRTEFDRREIRQSRDTCRYAWYVALHESRDFCLILSKNLSVITRRSSKEISEASRSPLPMYVHTFVLMTFT